MRRQEIDWLFADRPNRRTTPVDNENNNNDHINPAWRAFCEAVDVDPERMEYPQQALHGYYERFVLSNNDTIRQSAPRAWMSWEFYDGVVYQIPPGTNMTDRNATMTALDTWKDRKPATSPTRSSTCQVETHGPFQIVPRPFAASDSTATYFLLFDERPCLSQRWKLDGREFPPNRLPFREVPMGSVHLIPPWMF